MGNINPEPELNKSAKEYGFRIYKIYNFSPLKRLEIKELSDFIIPPNELYTKGLSFKNYLKEKQNQKIKLKIFSLLKRNTEEIEVEIDDKIDKKEGVLGCELNYENFVQAQQKLLHVIEVKENSFAKDNLYLIENQDYIIGIKVLDNGKYYSINNDKLNDLIVGFVDIINRNKGKDCEFYIYNIKRGIKIITTKIPENDNFSLGCDVAYGRVHEFPKNEEEQDEEKKSLK